MPARSRPPAPGRAFLNARRLAGERGIFHIEELHRMLESEGITITSSQLGKVLRNQSDYYSAALLEALRKVLDVSFSELLVSERPNYRKRAATSAPPTNTNPTPKTHEVTTHDRSQDDSTPRPPKLEPLPERTKR